MLRETIISNSAETARLAFYNQDTRFPGAAVYIIQNLLGSHSSEPEICPDQLFKVVFHGVYLPYPDRFGPKNNRGACDKLPGKAAWPRPQVPEISGYPAAEVENSSVWNA